jgi:hypothetical protein
VDGLWCFFLSTDSSLDQACHHASPNLPSLYTSG